MWLPFRPLLQGLQGLYDPHYGDYTSIKKSLSLSLCGNDEGENANSNMSSAVGGEKGPN